MGRLLIGICLFLGFGASVPAQELSSSKPTKVEDSLYHASQIALIGGFAWDMMTTAAGINHPMHASYTICAFGDCHPEESTTVFNEHGWTAGLVGAKSAPAVIGINLATVTATLVLSEVLHRKGGKWAKFGTLLNAGNAPFNYWAVAHNRSGKSAAERDLVPAGATDVVRW